MKYDVLFCVWKFSELRKKWTDRGSHLAMWPGVTYYSPSRMCFIYFLGARNWKMQQPSWKGTTTQSPLSLSCLSNKPQSLLSIFQWAKWFMSSEVKHGPGYESKFVKLAFPTLVYELIRLSFEYESPESATLLLTDCSFSGAIKPFVFLHHPTIPPASARRWRALWKQRGGMIYYSN